MKNIIYVPDSLRAAGRHIRHAVKNPIEQLPKREFVMAWSSLAYMYPGMHPDGIAEEDTGWPPLITCFVAEAWRRADAGELTELELYPADAQWSGLCDRLYSLAPEDNDRRRKLSAAYGDRTEA